VCEERWILFGTNRSEELEYAIFRVTTEDDWLKRKIVSGRFQALQRGGFG
jgi:hypothetical protein